MPGHRSFLRVGEIQSGYKKIINMWLNHFEFPKRYNYYPKLENAWTFGEGDKTPLRRVFKTMFYAVELWSIILKTI